MPTMLVNESVNEPTELCSTETTPRNRLMLDTSSPSSSASSSNSTSSSSLHELVERIVNMQNRVLDDGRFSIVEISPDHNDLIYRGEGNSSLVVAIESSQQVLRILKSDAKKLKNDEDIVSLLLQHIDFNSTVLSRFIPRCYFSLPKLVQLERKDLQFIRKLVADQRPSHRLTKTITDCEFVLLMPDYCTIPKSIHSKVDVAGPVLSVEIKPKSGFLPRAELFDEFPLLALKSETCRYGLAQFYKFRRELISTISDYCPLDLFSGCRSRAASAMMVLVENPQNNFRVFRDCQLVYADKYGGAVPDLDQFIRVLRDFFSSEVLDSKDSLLSVFCDLLVDALYDNLTVDVSEELSSHRQNLLPVDLLDELRRFETGAVQGSSFFVVFLQMFDRSIQSTLETPPVSSVDGDLSAEIAFPFFENVDTHDETFEDTFSPTSCPSSQFCRLHRSRPCSDQDCEHRLPPNSVMNVILEAQKLDTLDSVRAVKLYRALCTRFEMLKSSEICANLTSLKLIRLFVTENLSALSKLWQFLISLTAKDCSIMLAMQQIVRPSADEQQPPTNDNLRPKGVRIVRDARTGAEFVCSVSITDLDYKQAYKIERMFRNDGRMVAAMIDQKKKARHLHISSETCSPTTVSSDMDNSSSDSL